MTECGYDASKVKVVSRDEFFQRLKDLGQQRTAMLMCMTCADTARRWKTWSDDPLQALGREIEWERGGYYRSREDRGHRLKDEVLAIAALIEAHRDEFLSIINASEERRAWLEKKAAMSQRPKPPKNIGGL